MKFNNLILKILLCLLILIVPILIKAENDEFYTIRRGFFYGGGLGLGTLNINSKDIPNYPNDYLISPSIPNVKIGYFVSNNMAISILQPGAVYRLNDKDRVSESLQLVSQYWISKRLWLLAGIGVPFDIPAFYTVKDLKFKEFYSGFPSASLGAGYEIYYFNNYSIDLQYRLYYGNSYINSNQREAISNMFIIGLNWYFSKYSIM